MALTGFISHRIASAEELTPDLENCFVNLVTDDWEQAFMPHITDARRRAAFGQTLEEIRTPGHPQRTLLIARNIGSLAERGYSEVFVTRVEEPQGVARGRIYTPRNPFKRPYLYLPDALAATPDALEASIQWCKGNALNAWVGEDPPHLKAVVDTISPHNQEMLRDIGFRPTAKRKYLTPEYFKIALGDMYTVQQYTCKDINIPLHRRSTFFR